MSYKLFLDDERFPSEKEEDEFVVVRTYDEFVNTITTLGSPVFISFDHDLGDNSKDGFATAKWLVDYDLDYDVITKDFRFYVHSQNPVGGANIQGLLDEYLKEKFKEIVSISDL